MTWKCASPEKQHAKTNIVLLMFMNTSILYGWKCANTEKQHAKQTHCKNIFAFLLRYIDFKLLLIYYWINFFKKLTLNLFLFFNKRFRNRISYFLLHKDCNFFLHNRPINMFFKFLKYSFGYGIFFTLVLDLNMYDCTCTNEPSLFLYE